jgi:4,5-dihydroxyphthalate decarboxylase
MQAIFGDDPFPYGVEANRATWEQMALYTHQQGIAHRRFTPDEVFPASTATRVIV